MKSIWNEFKLMSQWQQVLILLLLMVNVLYLIYYAYWSFNTCAHFDDLRYLRDMKQMSMWNYLFNEYTTQTGRFIWLFVYGVMFKISLVIGSIRFWPFLFLLIGYWIVWSAIKNIEFEVSKLGIFLITIFCYNLYVHTAIDYAVFTWICAMLYYLLAPCLSLFISYLSREKLSNIQWCVFSFLILAMGGMNEAFTPVALITMFMYGIYLWRDGGWNIKETWSKVQTRRLVYSTIAILILFVIMVVAPGNFSRLEDNAVSEGFVHPDGIIGWGKAIAKSLGMFMYYMVFYLPYYIVPFCISAIIGTKNRIPLHWSKLLTWTTLIFCTYAIACVLPIAFIYNGFGIQRLYTYLVYGLILYICAVGYIIGIGIKEIKSYSLFIANLGMLMLLIIVGINLYKDVPIMKNYSKAVDERREYLLSLNNDGQTETIEVEAYPSMKVIDVKYIVSKWILNKECSQSDLYYRADTGMQPTSYEKYYKELFELNFDFVLKQE